MLCVGIAAAVSWAEWKALHNRSYTEDQDVLRSRIFAKNVADIRAMNARSSANGARFAVNHFANLTSEEFAARYLSPISPSRVPSRPRRVTPARAGAPLDDRDPVAVVRRLRGALLAWPVGQRRGPRGRSRDGSRRAVCSARACGSSVRCKLQRP